LIERVIGGVCRRAGVLAADTVRSAFTSAGAFSCAFISCTLLVLTCHRSVLIFETMIAVLRSLAERIDVEWKAAGYKPVDLPTIAARLMAETRPDRAYDLGALADWTFTETDFPASCNPFGPAGPPAFTVWSNPHFFVNVYAYTTPEVVIHDHDFAGAFINLSGVTIHCTYEFAAADSIDSNIQVGGLRLRGIEAIGDGSVRRIEPGQGFIHQVWHISQPTVVLVVRTPPLTATQRQFQYVRPSIATQVYRSADHSFAFPERFRHTRKMAECLRVSPAGVGYVKRLVEHERPWDAVWHLLENWLYLQQTGALEEVIARGAKYQGEWFAGIAAAGSELQVFTSINWRAVVSARERIVMALLLTFRSWSPMRQALEGLLPGIDPSRQVVESLTRLAGASTIPLELNPPEQALLTAMLRGEESEEAVDGLRTLRQQPLLRPLFHP
jgi:hypothetical protein